MSTGLTYLLIFAILSVIELCYFKIAERFNIIDRGGRRASHIHPVIRGGGIIFLFSVWIYSIFFGFSYPYFLAGLTLCALVSFWDDIDNISVGIRLTVQALSVTFVFIQVGVPTLNELYIFPIALIVGIGFVNAFNFMDGINGITGGYSLSVLIPLMYLNNQSQFISQSLLYTVTIGVVIFCFFNYRKKAMCFAGDVGSISIALIILFFITALIEQTGLISFLVLTAVYGVDSVMTIIHRLLLRENIVQAHRKHAYQIMANELKIPHTYIASVYSALQLAISFGFILLPVNKTVYFIAAIAGLSVIYIIFISRNYHLHREDKLD